VLVVSSSSHGKLLETGRPVDSPSNPTPTTVTVELKNSRSKAPASVPPASVPPASVNTPHRWDKLTLERLSDHEEAYVHNALNVLNPSQTALRMPYHIDLPLRHLHCLKPSVWLNDEVINVAMLLLQQLSKSTMVLSSFTKEKFLREFRLSQHDSRSKLAKQLGKHLKKHQVRSTTGLCHINV
jgi:hypothetical protein